jgi:hypothetical protein
VLNNNVGIKNVDNMILALDTCQEHLMRYMGHKVREQHQKLQFKHVKENQKVSELIVHLDHKQKILGRKYREAQTDYFGK